MWHEAARGEGAAGFGATGLAGGGSNCAEAVAESASNVTAAIANRIWFIRVPAEGRAVVEICRSLGEVKASRHPLGT
ncbi:hypothetical protein GCM10007857_54940 [Bradyrhizobium iriomotense]|uniref:Uncharacterized protein n=1 Tax=Bradyrhizobium iriomotense TaxID=441950 RepID=A0ABQ6B4M1_9BRAD|nr:hypothetical protein GCM10007857_54940 [Bradyrhizobium iriomotense]